MTISIRVATLTATGCTAALLALTGCASSTAHKAAAKVSAGASGSVSSPAVAGASTSPTTAMAHSTAASHLSTAHVATPAPASAKKTTAAPGSTASCGSQMSPGGHEYMVWNPISGKTETNPKCLGLSMHNTLLNLDYDLHGVQPAEAVLSNQGSAASTTRENVTVTFSNYGKVGSVSSLRTVTVRSPGHTLVWHLTMDGAGHLYWTVA
jgi:hypothetical protein